MYGRGNCYQRAFGQLSLNSPSSNYKHTSYCITAEARGYLEGIKVEKRRCVDDTCVLIEKKKKKTKIIAMRRGDSSRVPVGNGSCVFTYARRVSRHVRGIEVSGNANASFHELGELGIPRGRITGKRGDGGGLRESACYFLRV